MRRFGLTVVAFAALACIGAGTTGNVLETFINFTSDSSSEFSLTAEYRKKNDDHLIKLRCLERCGPIARYQLSEQDDFLTMFLMGEAWPTFIASTWTTGDSYVARVYVADNHGLKRVFNRHSCNIPIFGANRKNVFVVVTDEVHGSCLEWRYVTYYLTDKGPISVPGFVKER